MVGRDPQPTREPDQHARVIRTVEELRGLGFSPQDVRWLNLEA